MIILISITISLYNYILLTLKTKEPMSQLKEQNGRYYQQCKVVMLATNYGKLTLYDYKNLKTLSYALGNHKGSTNLIPQHLYILSNDEIKEGDWYIDDCNLIRKSVISDKNYWNRRPNYKKIIATTNESLKIGKLEYTENCLYKDEKEFIQISLPKPSDSFVSKYIEEYNKGRKIENILVEYEKF